MDWFRTYHGISTDPKLHKASRAAKVSRGLMLGAWIAVLEHASKARHRGEVSDLDPESLAFLIDQPASVAGRVLAAMGETGLIAAGRVSAWERHQRKSDDVAVRVRAHREGAEALKKPPPETPPEPPLEPPREPRNDAGPADPGPFETNPFSRHIDRDANPLTHNGSHGIGNVTVTLKNRTEQTLSSLRSERDPPVSPDGETSPVVGVPAVREASPKEAVEVWNRVAGTVLAKVIELTPQRRQLLRKRLADECRGDLARWEAYCLRIRGTPFCCGVNERGWRADLDFALRPGTWAKVHEGKYDSRRGTDPARRRTTTYDVLLDDVNGCPTGPFGTGMASHDTIQ